MNSGARGAVVFGDGGRATREDNSARSEIPDAGFRRLIIRPDLTVNSAFADPAGNQLGDLRSEIENQDPVMVGFG